MGWLGRFFKPIVLISLLLALVLMQACSKSVDLNVTEQKKNIALITKMSESVHWKTIKMGVETAAKEFDVNIEFYVQEDEEDVDGQIELANRALEKKPDGLILATGSFEALSEVAAKACDMGIPVISIDSDVNEKRVLSFIATDNKEAGKKAGNKLVEIAGTKCRVAILSFSSGSRNVEQREEGLMSIILQYPQIEVVCREYCLSNIDAANNITRKIISDHGEIDALVALNEITSLGAAEAVREMNLAGKTKIIAFDSTPEGIGYLDDGTIQAMVVQNPFNMGYLGVKYTVDVMNGKSIPKHIDTGSKVVDKKTMFMAENQKLLFPFVK